MGGRPIHTLKIETYLCRATNHMDRSGDHGRGQDWIADLHAQGRWSVTVELNDGTQVHEWGEFCELNVPNKILMTRRFAGHPLLGERETTATYRLEPSPRGTMVTVREEGFIGRSAAVYGNAENWEKVLGWLDDYLSKK
jgi:uncharacterized protein YndB with AHSA1/START domain